MVESRLETKVFEQLAKDLMAKVKAKQAYARRFPEDTALNDLARWQLFEAENPDTFSGVYLFWCRKA